MAEWKVRLSVLAARFERSGGGGPGEPTPRLVGAENGQELLKSIGEFPLLKRFDIPRVGVTDLTVAQPV